MPNSEKPRQYKGFKTYDDRGTDQFVDALPLATGHTLVLAPKNHPQKDRGQSGTHDELSMRGLANVATNLQLFNATGEQKYKDAFDETIWKALEVSVEASIQTALDALPIETEEYKTKLRPYVEKYKVYLDSISNENPYGVPIGLGNWAGSGAVTSYGTAVCAAHSAYPDIVTKDYIYAAANYLFGCHPYHNYSLVAAVGAARPNAVFYGNISDLRTGV